MNHFSNNHTTSRTFIYSHIEKNNDHSKSDKGNQQKKDIDSELLKEYLNSIGREALREKTPTLNELEQILESVKSKHESSGTNDNTMYGKNNNTIQQVNSNNMNQMSIVTYLINKGYIKDSSKWLTKKGFFKIGNKILRDVMRNLKDGEFGLHETSKYGNGSLILDTTKKYEIGNEINLINVPKTLINAITRIADLNEQINIPINLSIEDFEENETVQDVKLAVVYCIDLSSTMRYSTLFGDLSRIEAAKRSLWTLYLLNKKFFPSDSVSIVGFGALASKIIPEDIPYLRTFEPGADFLHYTNYQAAFRLARKILQKNPSSNKRIVLITDGHPSACFVDSKDEQENILSQRPYSHFYSPDKKTLEVLSKNNDINLDIKSGELVYLCYRYRQVDQYIGEHTINEAKKCKKMGIEIDTIMISEEDSLLSYVNDMEKCVKGRSYYINPANIDKILLTDYIKNKRKIINSST